MAVSYADIKHEFDVTLGYIHDDIRALCAGTETVNYTVALLIGVACEALEDAGFYANKKTALADLLPDADWRQLAGVLYEALRNGLAHNFDTKHIHVNGQVVQIYLVWRTRRAITIEQRNGEESLSLGTCVLGKGICDKINEFRAKLQSDPVACERFKTSLNSSGRQVDCKPALWNILRKNLSMNTEAEHDCPILKR
jgi:hypothetical protein